MSYNNHINIQRTLEIPEIKSIIDSFTQIRNKKTLWGVAPVSPLHLGYDSLILLQKALLGSGASHNILLSDIHAMMSHGLNFDEVNRISNYYHYYLSNICELNATFIRGSYFQMRSGYIEDLYGILSAINVNKIKGTFPTSRKNEPFIAYQVIYPCMQCLDCYHIDIDIAIGEESQKKIYRLTDIIRKSKPLRSWILDRMNKDITFFYIPTSHDIMGDPLIISSAKTRISVHETADTLSMKIKRMYAPPGKQQPIYGKINALLEFFKYSVFPWTTESIKIKTTSGFEEYKSYNEFERDYYKEFIIPQDAKKTIYEEIWNRIEKIQNKFREGITTWVDIQKAVGGNV